MHADSRCNYVKSEFYFAIQLNTVRELSIMSAKSHPAAMHIIPDMADEPKCEESAIQSSLLLQQPSR